MRRSDREITDFNEIISALDGMKECCLSMVDGGKPYSVVMNFGFEVTGEKLTLYFHSATDGRKINVLKADPTVYVEAYTAAGVIEGANGNPCAYSYAYKSVAGEGRAEFITDAGEKSHALNLILKHVAGLNSEFSFPATMLDKTCVFKVTLKNITGKQRI